MPGFIALFAMADIRKRNGSKGITYQVRYPSKAAKTGYAYKTFETLKEARDFREDAAARVKAARANEIRTVDQALHEMARCLREGRHATGVIRSRHAPSPDYEYRAAIISAYGWTKELHELTAAGHCGFRSWLLKNIAGSWPQGILSSFHSMVREMMRCEASLRTISLPASASTRASRYDQPVTIPTAEAIACAACRRRPAGEFEEP